jgi:hypothetical protein
MVTPGVGGLPTLHSFPLSSTCASKKTLMSSHDKGIVGVLNL